MVVENIKLLLFFLRFGGRNDTDNDKHARKVKTIMEGLKQNSTYVEKRYRYFSGGYFSIYWGREWNVFFYGVNFCDFSILYKVNENLHPF